MPHEDREQQCFDWKKTMLLNCYFQTLIDSNILFILGTLCQTTHLEPKILYLKEIHQFLHDFNEWGKNLIKLEWDEV
jgi:hypothetical protein